MLFYRPEFLVFSIILLATLVVVNRGAPRKLVLLLASYVFYMWWNPAFILLIVFATAVNYSVGVKLEGENSPARRKFLLVLGLVLTLGQLAVFKYTNFLEDNMLAVMRLLGYKVSWTSLNVILPVGISFYTFQTLSYTIDVYRKKLPACHSPLDFALFVAFFPQLVAGPIVRAADFLPQLKKPTSLCLDRTAFFLIVRGLAKKVLIADNLAVFADAIFSDVSNWPSVVIWIATLCFYVQIYCDFSGYSDVAIGVGRMLGFRLPLNFDRPYFSTSPGEFWHRWHISLSTWLRDYLYIPLGGNRYGPLMTGRNIMLTMLLGGLWHGASWNFVMWGFLHGLALIVHRVWCTWKASPIVGASRGLQRLYAVLAWAALQYWVLLTWIPFRVTDRTDMLHAMSKFVWFDFDLNLSNMGLGQRSVFSTLIILAAFLAIHAISQWCRGLDKKLAAAPLWLSAPGCVIIGAAFFLFWPLNEVPFIYFQF